MGRVKKDKVFEYKGWWIEQVAGSPYWYGFRYNPDTGRVSRTSLGTDDLDTAKDELIAMVQLEGPKTDDSLLAAVLEAYFRDVSDAQPSAETARYAGMHILDFWGAEARVSDVTVDRQQGFWDWSKKKGHKPSTTSRNLTVLSAALRHGIRSGPVPRVITSAKKVATHQGVPEPQPVEWIPSDDELARFLDSLDDNQGEHVFRYSLIALNTLARPGCILELAPACIDTARGLIDLNPKGRAQNNKRRPIVRLTDTLRPWLASWHQADMPYVRFRDVAVGSVRRTFKRHGAGLGFPQFTPYTLRHKMATELAARGVPQEVLQRQLGHKVPDMRTTARYIKFDPRHLAEAKSAIEDYLFDLNRITDRDLLRPNTLNLLSSSGLKMSAISHDRRLIIQASNGVSNGGAGSPSERVFAQEFPAIRENSKDGRKKSLIIAGPADFS